MAEDPSADTRDTLPVTDAGAIVQVSPGMTLDGGFSLSNALGRGGMGAVYEALDEGLQRKVAVKVPLHPGDGRLLVAEARALGAIRHPGIVAVHHLGRHQAMPFLVMERLHGTPLDQLLARRFARGLSFEVDEALDIVARLADTLAYVHDCGVAHFDVKPANVVMAGRRAVLLDFGLVLPEYAAEPTASVAGTPAYLAPERIRGNVGKGEAHLCDVYSLGCTLWELLVGETPFESGAKNVEGLLRQQLYTPVPDPRRDRAEIPGGVVALLHDMLEKEPEGRPSMQEVVWSLRHLRHPERGGRSMTVLVVEDDPDLAELVSAWIETAHADARVIVEDTAEAAIRAIRDEDIDLALLDLQLPGMSGIELCMYLRGGHGDFPFPVAVMSATAARSDVALLRQLGVEAFLPKQADLEIRLRELLLGVSRRRKSTHRSLAPPIGTDDAKG